MRPGLLLVERVLLRAGTAVVEARVRVVVVVVVPDGDGRVRLRQTRGGDRDWFRGGNLQNWGCGRRLRRWGESGVLYGGFLPECLYIERSRFDVCLACKGWSNDRLYTKVTYLRLPSSVGRQVPAPISLREHDPEYHHSMTRGSSITPAGAAQSGVHDRA